jgi:prophage tail gpP-like protein
MPPTIFKPSEVATLYVNGQLFNQWESVWAQERWCEAFSYFRFTSVEYPAGSAGYTQMLVTPCNGCTLKLGGQLAMSGYVMQRQVAYDADRHQIMLIGKSASFWGFKSFIKLKEANMDGMTLKQMADHLLGPRGVGVEWWGTPDNYVWEKAQASPGTNIWQWLDDHARSRHINLSTWATGAVLIGPHGTDDVDVLEEGVNIKKMQVTFSIEDTWQEVQVVGQISGSDQQSGPDAQEQEADTNGSSCVTCSLVVPMEEPVKDQEVLQKRADFEAHWSDATQIVANITVQGWFTSSGTLWHAGQSVFVKSLMAPLSQSMKIKTVTWQQDNENGTETVLECVWPKLGLNDFSVNVGDPAAEPNKTEVVPQPATPPEAPQSAAKIAIPPTTTTLSQQLGIDAINPSLAQQLGIGNIK